MLSREERLSRIDKVLGETTVNNAVVTNVIKRDKEQKVVNFLRKNKEKFYTASELKDKFGYKTNSLSGLFKRNNIVKLCKRDELGRCKVCYGVSDRVITQFIEPDSQERSNYYSYTEIAEECNCEYSRVYTILRRDMVEPDKFTVSSTTVLPLYSKEVIEKYRAEFTAGKIYKKRNKVNGAEDKSSIVDNNTDITVSNALEYRVYKEEFKEVIPEKKKYKHSLLKKIIGLIYKSID